MFLVWQVTEFGSVSDPSQNKNETLAILMGHFHQDYMDSFCASRIMLALQADNVEYEW